MSVYLYFFLIIFGIMRICLGVYFAGKHGEPRGNYDARIEAIEVLIGVLMILFALEVV